MKAKLFKIRLITNLHMGSGETTFNFIDNQVQRDPVSEYPNMHSSGIKGALRDFFSLQESENYVRSIFGGEEDENASTQGKLSFIEGKLLALPVRSNKKSYFIGTTLGLIKEYIEFGKLFSKNYELDINEIEKLLDGKKACVFGDEEKGLLIEDIENNEINFNNSMKEKIEELLGVSDVVIINEEFFKEDVAKRLPIIARNKLENGVSQNLWYEEVVPRESVFYTGIINSQNISDEEFEKFSHVLEENLVQIGANATIGYGFTKFIEVK